MTEEKYAIFIIPHCQLLDKWQYYLIEKYGMQDSEWVVTKDQKLLGERMQIVKNNICSF